MTGATLASMTAMSSSTRTGLFTCLFIFLFISLWMYDRGYPCIRNRNVFINKNRCDSDFLLIRIYFVAVIFPRLLRDVALLIRRPPYFRFSTADFRSPSCWWET